MELKPSREAFCKLAAETNLIAVAKEINMDLDTPVSVYYKLVGEKKGFILESVDTTHRPLLLHRGGALCKAAGLQGQAHDQRERPDEMHRGRAGRDHQDLHAGL